MSDHQESNSVDGAETSVEEPMGGPVVAALDEESKVPWGPIVGGIAVAGALIGAVWFATSGDSEVDLASTDPVEAVAEESGSEEEPMDEETSDESDDVANADTDEADGEEYAVEESEEAMMEDFAMDSVYGGFYGSSTQAVWLDGQFVRLENNRSGWTAFTSADGLDWAESPATGLPAEGYMYNLVGEDGLIAGIVEQYNENGASHRVASSTNGIDWTTVELAGTGENSEAGYSGIALVDGNIVTIRTIHEYGNDPYLLLSEAGILDGIEEEFCGFDYADEGAPIELKTCSYEDNSPTDEEVDALAARYDEAETDEERSVIERELEELWGGDQEVFMTINPGDPLYAELQESFFGEPETEMTVEVISGPVAGPFVVSSPFSQNGYMTGLFQTDSAMFVGFETYDERSESSDLTILTSTNGQSWSEVSTPPASNGGGLQGIGNVLFFTSYDEAGGSTSYVSVDGAQTWSESSLETALYQSSSTFMAGNAGIVAMTQGLLEPYEYNEGYAPEENPVLEKDGFTLELGWGDGSMILSGPDGVITEVSEEEASSNSNDLVRSNPINGNLTFIDPETGEDLVTFTEDDWERAYGSFEEEHYEEEVYEEPEQGIELAFSLDGVSWTSLDASQFNGLGYNSSVGLVGVGDDEAVFFIETYNESDFPEEVYAFEEEGREPTDAEIEAIELWEGNQSSIEYIRVPLG